MWVPYLVALFVLGWFLVRHHRRHAEIKETELSTLRNKYRVSLWHERGRNGREYHLSGQLLAPLATARLDWSKPAERAGEYASFLNDGVVEEQIDRLGARRLRIEDRTLYYQVDGIGTDLERLTSLVLSFRSLTERLHYLAKQSELGRLLSGTSHHDASVQVRSLELLKARFGGNHEAVAAARHQLSSNDVEVALAALELLDVNDSRSLFKSMMRNASRPVPLRKAILDALLESSDARGERAALWEAIVGGAPDLVDLALLDTMIDEVEDVRALQLLSALASAQSAALEVRRRALDWYCTEAAVDQLAPVVRDVLEAHDTPEPVAVSALNKFLSRAPAETWTGVLIVALLSPKAAVRAIARHRLETEAPADALPRLIVQLAKVSQPLHKQLIMRLLGEWSAVVAEPALIAELSNDAVQARQAAVEALETCGTRYAVQPLLAIAASDSSRAVRTVAQHAIGSIQARLAGDAGSLSLLSDADGGELSLDVAGQLALKAEEE